MNDYLLTLLLLFMLGIAGYMFYLTIKMARLLDRFESECHTCKFYLLESEKKPCISPRETRFPKGSKCPFHQAVSQ